ncbi:MAG TPA: C4-dicarboxylate TRAP transporter substrate-binding protein [Alphaproteobacteria bacterium]|nr:C4-dicarboxylate TRAP transporter substrate-binding protein [Alphaproteobacteria bacterium]
MRSLKTLTFGVAAAAMVAVSAPLAGAAEFKLTAGSSHPPIIPWVGTIKNFVVPESVKRLKAMGGKHTIKWTEAYAGALYNWQNTLEGVQEGLADVGWVGTLWEPNKLPLMNVTYFTPFATNNVAHLTQIQNEMHAKLPILNKQWRKYNQVFIGAQTIDNYVIVSKTPIRSVDDLKGKKFYAPAALAGWVRGTGAISVNGALPLYYNGIKTGVTDGAIIPGTGVLPFKIHEVAPYVIDPGLGGMISGALTMNLATWNKLPADMKKLFKQLGTEYGELVTKRVTANRVKHFAIIAKNGAKLSTFPLSEKKRWTAKMPNIAGEWAKNVEAKGLPARQIMKFYLDGVRKRGGQPVRDWDKES